MSHVIFHMSGVRCQMLGVRCNFYFLFFIFFTKRLSLLVEGMLSMGPTLYCFYSKGPLQADILCIHHLEF